MYCIETVDGNMGSETGGDARTTLAVDSDGSDTWEDFFGTSTDLVPQLLGMFDELARRSAANNADHVVLPSCNIPAALQKRLSLLPRAHRGSLLGPLYASESFMASQQIRSGESKPPSSRSGSSGVEITVEHEDNDGSTKEEITEVDRSPESNCKRRIGDSLLPEYARNGDSPGGKLSYDRASNGASPLRYNRRCRTGGRPLSGSSIASSTSSSGCSNQGIASATNPYLASVESLADTCASSQGSADSGVVTVSDTICQRETEVACINQRRDSVEREPLSYQPRPRYCDPHRNPVERVLLEIVDTEAVYVEHLRQVIQGYLIYWRDDPRSLVDQSHLSDLFSNIEDIYEFNSEFLKELERCGLDPVCVANIFVKHNSGFKVYTEYCTNYPRTVSVLTEFMGQERTAYAFRERQSALGHALPLGSFLLKPVQRILKYHLLLQNLSKECDAEGDDSEVSLGTINAIESALAAMTGIARHINVMKRKHEHAVRVQEIQSLLYGWPGPDLTTSGELVAEGRFRMRGAKAPRHAFLFDRMLLLTKKKEDGVLVYKAHIMCSNLMLIESIPGEALSFHVIPFDNPRLQYTLQARNLEQKREWTMQIKRVIIENYNAVIPSHARQLVMELGQTQPEDESTPEKGSAKKQHSAPPEYLEKRKQERERRKLETGFRQRLRRTGRKSEPHAALVEVSLAVRHLATLLQPAVLPPSDIINITQEDSPNGSRKNQSTESVANEGRDRSLNRSADGRTLKVKDRFASWRRKSEPGFQSYVSLNQSDEDVKEEDAKDEDDEKDSEAGTETTVTATEAYDIPMLHQEVVDSPSQPLNNSPPLAPVTKETNEKQEQARTMEEIVGHILMQNRDFQKLLEKQRTSSAINMRQQQRFNKRASIDTSDDSETDRPGYGTDGTNNIRGGRTRGTRREQRIVRANNARNSTSPPISKEDQPMLRLRYDNLHADGEKVSSGTDNAPRAEVNNRTNRIYEKRAIFEAFKRQSIVTESKVMKTALRIRETANSKVELDEDAATAQEETLKSRVEPEPEPEVANETDESRGFGNYDNLQRVWQEAREREEIDDQGESPTRPAVWLTKLCEGLPTTTQKCGSLPRSFQMNQDSPKVTKARFLQRDGKPMHERPFTIASDKPAEINLEDMERYASSCQPGGRIAKFPTSASSSTFFCSLDEALDDYSSQVLHPTSVSNVHPDYKIYRPNGSPAAMLKNVLSRAGSRLQGLRSTESIDTLECQSDEADRSKTRTVGGSKSKKKHKLKSSKESSSDVDDVTGSCVGTSPFKGLPTTPAAYYQQGSSGLGARIAQSDYADPAVLFADTKRTESVESPRSNLEEERVAEATSTEQKERRESEADSFYERSFEAIENYVDADADEAFRDSAIFSDMDEVSGKIMVPTSRCPPTKPKIAPPVPAKRRVPENSTRPVKLPEIKPGPEARVLPEVPKTRPYVARKPEYLKVKAKICERTISCEKTTSEITTTRLVFEKLHQISTEERNNEAAKDTDLDRDDVSAGQSRAGWVRKMVGQLQGQVES